MTAGVKGSSSSLPESRGQEEEVARKTKEETARRLEEGARKILAEETQREKEVEEAVKRKKEEEEKRKEETILENIIELEKEIAQETQNLGQEIQDQERAT